MNFLQNNLKAIVIIGMILISSGVIVTVVILNLNSNDRITVTLLNNAGVMIEADDTRIYIDPFDLPSTYSNYPADLILITHVHGDHYDPSSIDLILTENTRLYFPANMSLEASQYGADSVQPEDTFLFNSFNVTCFYMYTLPVAGQSSHPQSSNYTSFIIDLGGFTIFHSGDSKNIYEYEQLTGLIDLVFLPLGPGCQTMVEMEVVQVVETIEPSYFIPIHFTEDSKNTFFNLYEEAVEACGCKFINLEYYDSYGFN